MPIRVAKAVSNSDLIQEGSENKFLTDARTDAESIAHSEGIVITVKTDETGDFTNLSDAVASITDSSKSKKYTIKIYEGTYDVFSTLTTAELAGVGIVLPNYVDLKGIGDRDSIIIKGELADTATLDESTRLSPLNVKYNNNLFNITVTAKNCRYAVHADNSNTFKNYVQYIEDCVFKHLGNAAGLWNACLAWGEGTASGAKEYFKRCKFEGSGAFSTHNNVNFSEGDYHEFENCQFVSDYNSAQFITLNSGKVSRVVMNGCSLSTNIAQTQSDASVTGLEYEISGHGNSIVPHIVASAQEIQKYINFPEEIAFLTNQSGVEIPIGTPLKYYSASAVTVMTSENDVTLFAGLCAVDCLATDKKVVVRKSGYFSASDLGLTGLTTGKKIGIVGGSLAVVKNASNAIAVAMNADWIKIIDNISQDGEWLDLTLLGTWAETETAQKPQYKKTRYGEVLLRGRVKSGALFEAIATLPEGYKPTREVMFITKSSASFGLGYIQTAGNIVPSVGETTAFVLDGISFYVD